MSRRDACPQPMRRRLLAPSLAVLVCVWSSGSLHAQTRYARHFGVDDGLVPDYVVSLAQDRVGLLWIGTAGGLYRYDGVEMRHWAPTALRSWVSALVVSADGTVVALDEDQGGVFEVTPDGARPVLGPEGRPLRGVHHIAADATGTLWALRGDDVLVRDPAGRWTRRHRDALDGTRLQRAFAAAAGGAFVLTSAGVWYLGGGAPPRRVAEAEQPRHVLELPDGGLLIVTFDGRVLEARSGRSAVLLHVVARGIAAVERNGTYWVAYDRYLVSLTPGMEPELLGPEDGIVGGGPLLVDHEGSLWVGTGAGLLQFPEPSTRIWTERHGLPIAHTRFLARTGDTTWVSTWRGPAAIVRHAGRWRAWAIKEWASVRRLFAGDDGALRGQDAGFPELFAFDTKEDGSEWFGTRNGLFVARAPDAAPERVTGLPFASDTVTIHAVLHDGTGRTWLASEHWICHAPNVAPRNAAEAAWTCDEIRSGHHVSSLVASPGGSVWASFVRGGVWRYRAGAWGIVGDNHDPPLLDVLGLVPAPSGGVWVVGSRVAARAVDDRDAPGGVRITEQLSSGHGLRVAGAGDILEEPDGTLWLSTAVGVARIPSAARRPSRPPHRVVLVDASVDGERVSLRDELILPNDHNRLALRFAAPSYRDPSRLRYEVRLSPNDAWTPVSGPPVFRWVNLRAGRYRAEVRASLDGRAWTPEPARFAFRVLPPWYLAPWALTLFGVLAAGVVVAAYRARVAFLLRLERQRTRIAMDLHDEMGSGLGSIGILSGVLAAGPSDPTDRRRLVTQIAEIAQDLGTALSDIVWSLDPRSSTLEDVAGRLVEHGGRLFAADSVRFTARFPEAWPAAPLDFPVRRAVLLIGLEALHNAARHARAGHVTLSVEQADGDWRLVVEDDGCGMAHAGSGGDRAGVGLRSLRRRAAEIGGRIVWAERAGGGTRVTLQFRPSGRPRRWGRHRPSHDHASARDRSLR